jgi:hypothetical protein
MKMPEDDTEEIAIEDADREFTWDEAVARAKTLHYWVEASQLKLGKLASKVHTKYGEESLRNFAKETEIPFETLKRYRSVWRAWETQPRIPVRYSVARALARIPDKERVFDRLVDERDNEGAVTEEAAIKAAKQYRMERSAGKYDDFVLHRIVSLICRKLGTIAREDSELTHAIDDYLQYKETDLEYFRKVVDTIDDAIGRLSALRQKVSNGFFDEAMKEPEKTEPEAPETEPAKEEPKIEDMGTIETTFRIGESED